MTLAGLNTINLSQINTFQQFLLFLLTMLGSAIFVSIAVVHIRKKAFERKFKSIAENESQKRRGRTGSRRRLSFSGARSSKDIKTEVADDRISAVPDMSIDTKTHKNGVNRDAIRDHSAADREAGQSSGNITEPNKSAGEGETEEDDRTTVDERIARRITFASPSSPVRARSHNRVFSMQGVGARQQLLNHPSKASRLEYPSSPSAAEKVDLRTPIDRDRFRLTGFIGRNSQFSSLTLAERERLGGVEYRAVTFLAVVVPMYFFLWQFLGCLGLGAYVANNRPGVARDNGLNPWYVCRFSLRQDHDC